MSTKNHPMTEAKKILTEACLCLLLVVAIQSIVGFVAACYHYVRVEPTAVPINYLTFTVESTEVKLHNLTFDDRLHSLVTIGIRAVNADLDGHSMHLNSLRMEARKGAKGYVIADGGLPEFRLIPGSEELVHVDIVGLVGASEEVRADVAAANEGLVDVLVSGRFGKRHGFNATCEGVVIDCSTSEARVQKVACEVRVPSGSADRFSFEMW